MSWGNAISQGGTYAAAGSMFGPWGTLIGGGLGLAMGAMQDDPEKVDVQKLLGPDLTRLRSRSDEMHKLGGELTAQGTDALSPVLSYYKSLLSGNPASVLAATTPERGRIIDQYDTARKAISMGPRGGGTTSAMAQSQIAQGNDLQEILTTARDKGAAGAAAVGSSVLGAGMQANALANQSLDQVIGAVLGGAGLDIRQNESQAAQDAAQGEAMGTMIGLLLTSGKLGGMGRSTGGRVSHSFANAISA